MLSYALFPQVALKFFDARDAAEAAEKAATTDAATDDPAAVRTLYVEDVSIG